MKYRLASLIVVSVLGLSGCKGPLASPPVLNAKNSPAETAENTTVYLNLSVIDGTGTPLQKDRAIVVRGTKIAAILPSSEMKNKVPEGAKVIDAKGMFAVPGLVDSHVHMATMPDDENAQVLLRRYVYGGITSIRDMAGDGRALADLARRTRLKEIAAPDLYYAALMAGPSFFTDPRPGMSAQGEKPGHVPWMQAITPETDMTEAVALARGTWASGIKIYANLAAEEVRRIAKEGRRQGIKVWAHSMVFPAFTREVVGTDVDVISHVCRLAFEISKEKPTQYHHKVVPDYANLNPRHQKIKAILQTMKDKDVVLDATVWLYAELERMRQENPKVKTIPVKCPVDFAAKVTRFAHDLGVDISTGTDGATPEGAPYPALHEELDVLQNKVGMTPLQIIRSATYVGAKALGIEQETGTLEVGKKADIVIVTENPAKDISNLRSVFMTIKGGTEYSRRDFKNTSTKER